MRSGLKVEAAVERLDGLPEAGMVEAAAFSSPALGMRLKSGDLPVVAHLLDAMASVSAGDHEAILRLPVSLAAARWWPRRRTLLHIAAQIGRPGSIRALHTVGLALDAEEIDGTTPAHRAALKGHVGCLRVLHELGAGGSLSAPDTHGKTPAHFAAQRGHPDCLRVLHELGAGASFFIADRCGYIPAHRAAMNGHSSCLRALGDLGAGVLLSAATRTGVTPANLAARKGHDDSLRVLHELGAGVSFSIAELDGTTPAHRAARNGRPNCLRLLHVLGTGAPLAVLDRHGYSPANHAAIGGHPDCLRVIHSCTVQTAAHATLTAKFDGRRTKSSKFGGAYADFYDDGYTPAHQAARFGNKDCLHALHEAGCHSSFAEAAGHRASTPAMIAVAHGHTGCLRVLHAVAGPPAMVGDVGTGITLAHIASLSGQQCCLRALVELGEGASLSLADKGGSTPAYYAAKHGHPGCLEVLHVLGAGVSLSAVNNDGQSPAHVAVLHRHYDDPQEAVEARAKVLTLLHREGVPLDVPDFQGQTPAYLAASVGHDDCLVKMYHIGLSAFIAAGTSGPIPSHDEEKTPYTEVLRRLRELAIAASLGKTNLLNGKSPADIAGEGAHHECLIALHSLGVPTADTVTRIAQGSSGSAYWDPNGSRTLAHLEAAGVPISLKVKQQWLTTQLKLAVGDNPDESRVNLHANRASILEGLCDLLGVDPTSGQVGEHVAAGPLSVQFLDEHGVGDGVRRDWFENTVNEILDEQKGLFLSKDGGRTLQPNPHSKLAAGPDHLSYFALLGRIIGFALFHSEHIPAPWTTAFVKATFEYPIVLGDLESVDPELYRTKVAYIRDRTYATRDGMTLEDLELTFEADFSFEDYSAKGASAAKAIELKPDGASTAVTEDNRLEYLELLVNQRLIGDIQEQVSALRQGLDVFFKTPERPPHWQISLKEDFRRLCTPVDALLLLCGAGNIDLDDWEQNTAYTGELTASSSEARRFWNVVRSLTAAHQAKLLHFCTGSSRAPAAGFEALRGYNGRRHRFRLQLDDRGGDRLPTAATCFNTLKLPRYASEQQAREKIITAITSASGFDEGAVAE